MEICDRQSATLQRSQITFFIFCDWVAVRSQMEENIQTKSRYRRREEDERECRKSDEAYERECQHESDGTGMLIFSVKCLFWSKKLVVAMIYPYCPLAHTSLMILLIFLLLIDAMPCLIICMLSLMTDNVILCLVLSMSNFMTKMIV